MYKFFTPAPETLEELKGLYRKLAMRHHPDRGGDTETMKAVNTEYDILFPLLKDVHKNKDGETYTAKRSTSETADQFKNLITELMKMEGIEIEIIGRFVWVTGDTKPHRGKLKALGFKWHNKKTAWYLAPDGYRPRSRRDYDLDEIRDMYGTSGKVSSHGVPKLSSI